MNPFLRYLADKNSAHRQTDRQTDRHTPMTTRPCGLRRAGKDLLSMSRSSSIMARTVASSAISGRTWARAIELAVRKVMQLINIVTILVILLVMCVSVTLTSDAV